MLADTNVSQSDEKKIPFVCYGTLKTLPNHINLLGLRRLNKESQETESLNVLTCYFMNWGLQIYLENHLNGTQRSCFQIKTSFLHFSRY